MKFAQALAAASLLAASMALEATTEATFEPPEAYLNGEDTILPKLCARRDTLTISGAGKGGQFAHQYQIANSATIQGVGIQNSDPWFDWSDLYCIQDPTSPYCDTTERFLPDLNVYLLDRASEDGKVDDLSNLTQSAVYIVSGTEDEVSPAEYQDIVENLYLQNDTSLDWIKYEALEGVGHERTEKKGGEMVKWLLQTKGYLDEIIDDTCDPSEHGMVTIFDQQEIIDEWYPGIEHTEVELERWGQIYTPFDCWTEPCHIHVVFHGEESIMNDVDDGYDYVAARNKIIVIYPAATNDWEYWYSNEGSVFSNRDAQHRYHHIINAMINRLGSCEPQSTHADVPIEVHFTNQSGGQIELIWWNFDRLPVSFGIIDDGETMPVNTFVSHPWTASGPNGDVLIMGEEVWFAATEDADQEIFIGAFE